MKTEEKLANMRHTLSHLLAAATLELYPDTKLTLGPSVDNGFYYDMEFSKPISDKDLPKIEKTMKKLLPKWESFDHKEVSKDEALEIYKDNPYKKELIEEIFERGEKITLYTVGGFTDLCRGGHVEKPSKDIDPEGFTLSHVAGAYWRGKEDNPMLTRVYGLAFENKKDLDAHLEMQEEAKKRDHKKLGKELDLFSFSPLVGGGLPLWSPKGTVMRNLLDDFVWELRREKGYEKVTIPHITKKDLFVTSGHWDKYGDDLFKISTREGHEYALKPMNCPFHAQIYARTKWSYRDLPQRYADTTMVYRDEQSGELSGLSRVLSITQDDAHVFCRVNQIEEEILAIWDIIEGLYCAFDFKLEVRLSLRDPNEPDKYLGDEKTWEMAEDTLREVVKKRKAKAEEAEGEAAFYGPKLDFVATDSLGREWQVATIQLDMNMPERFDLVCTNEKGEDERIVMIHAAIMGSIERFMSVMIEHTAGVFPVWLSPVQVRVLSISEKHKKFAQEVADKLKDAGIRVLLDDTNETLGKKIRAWKIEKTPYALVIGDKEMDSKKLTLESRNGDKKELALEKLVEKLQEEISNRHA